MKKAIVGLIVSMFMLGSLPALAATNDSTQQTYDNTLKQLISLLLQEISSLEQQLAQQKANQSSTLPTTSNTTTSSNTATSSLAISVQNVPIYGSNGVILGYSSSNSSSAKQISQFQDVGFEIYHNNPNQYIGSNISVIGELDGTFLPANGYSSNYIEIEDLGEISQPKIEVEIDNQNDYTAAVNSLSSNDFSFIRVYGVGMSPQEFTLTNGQYTYLPVVSASSIDLCTDQNASESNGVVSCGSWKTIFSDIPGRSVNQLQSSETSGCDWSGCSGYTPSQGNNAPSQSNQTNAGNTNSESTSITTTSTTSTSQVSSNTGQCDFNGDVFTCTSVSNITATPQNLPDGIIGTSYNQAININDPYSQENNYRWNIIGGLMPPGIGFAFSPTQAIKCNASYCFFSSPPAGSYPSTNPSGYFFGTPTEAGNYSPVLQVIDDSNHVENITFNINIANSK